MFALSKTCKSIFTTRKFRLKDQHHSEGFLVKCTLKEGNSLQFRDQLRKLIQQYPNSMFILTAPTLSIKCLSGKFPYPGHNCVLISNQDGEIASCMSKRPNTSSTLLKGKRIRDPRFLASYLPEIRAFTPRFTNYEEDIDIWMKKALSTENYPLYIHIMPLKKELGTDAADFQAHVDCIRKHNFPYILHSIVNPQDNCTISASNCNGAVYEAIFGCTSLPIQNMFCQEAAMNIMSNFVYDYDFYEYLAIDMGLIEDMDTLSHKSMNTSLLAS